jgi:predicted nucleic-acid-binding protein
VKGIDTNVLIRYLVRDDQTQFRAARRFIENDCQEEEPGFITHVVLAELVWVLERGYKYSRSAIVNVLATLLRTSQLSIEQSDDAASALYEYQNGADFADSLIAATNLRVGCEWTATLDRKAARHKGFQLIQ